MQCPNITDTVISSWSIIIIVITILAIGLQNGGKEKQVNVLNSGQYFGELALITHKPRAANVYADTDVKAAFLGE